MIKYEIGANEEYDRELLETLEEITLYKKKQLPWGYHKIKTNLEKIEFLEARLFCNPNCEKGFEGE